MSAVWCPAVAAGALMLMSGCGASDQSQARRALAKTGFSQCLEEARWIAAERTGALTFSPFSGLGFIAFDRPIKRIEDIEDNSFVPMLVGSAKRFPIYPYTILEAAYRRAGSPASSPNAGARLMGFDGHLFHVDKRIGSGWVRGRVKGWVTREKNYYCATDIGNGRFFIVTEFDPSFPIGQF